MKDYTIKLSNFFIFLILTASCLFGIKTVAAACNPGMSCAMHFDPVCGADGRTYFNRCMANRVCVDVEYPEICIQPPQTCQDHDKDMYSPDGGDCGPVDCNDQDPYINPDMACIEIYEPVCGVDGKTYPNSCEALRVCAVIAHPGECEQATVCIDEDQDGYSPEGGECGPVDCNDNDPIVNPGMMCTQEYAPVCGVDGKTYGNACEAERACVEIAHPGECAEEPPVCTIDPDMVCTGLFAPVCGVDGKTYGNECEAERVCVEIAHPGQCHRWWW